MTGLIEPYRPGLVRYDEAFAWQQARAEAVRAGAAREALAMLRHPPVYTLGMRGERRHVLVTPEALAERGADLVATDRGGDVTFHGPGQLVAYPILDLRRRGLGPATFVRMLEAVLIETLARFDIEAGRVAGRPGVWVRGAKAAALGVRVRGGVSTHGVALNVSTDLAWFDAIVPCGIADAGVTSMERLLGVAPPHETVEDAFIEAFARVFEVRVAHLDAAEVA
ncbi:MAG: lipoyl(octanoyl) transferase LipB [Dehalococcoidia bacterium]